MNKTTLDALLIDRALGTLPPETEALLDAYLERTPGIRAALDSTFDTIKLARKALREEKTVDLPVFQAPKLVRRRLWRRRSLQVTGMAAALMIGFFVGRAPMDRPAASLPAPRKTGLESVSKPEITGFWSITPERLSRTKREPSRWKWHSPAQQPRLTAQEKHHEI